MHIPSKHLNIMRESFLTLDARNVEFYDSQKIQAWRTFTFKDFCREHRLESLFDIPDSPNPPTERPHNSDLLNCKNLSEFRLGLAEANRGIFAILDSRSPSPIYINTEDMFNIPYSPLRCPSPAPSGLDSNLADANRGVFDVSDSRSPSPVYIDTEDMFVIRFLTRLSLSCSLWTSFKFG
jgi:hypothetical protein